MLHYLNNVTDPLYTLLSPLTKTTFASQLKAPCGNASPVLSKCSFQV
ncbi:MAG: hypothetical protein IPN60_13295 [Saprospiraceae bacterium]|nr:hypothetical protein [Candidatus Opimibacter skivensis]